MNLRLLSASILSLIGTFTANSPAQPAPDEPPIDRDSAIQMASAPGPYRFEPWVPRLGFRAASGWLVERGAFAHARVSVHETQTETGGVLLAFQAGAGAWRTPDAVGAELQFALALGLRIEWATGSVAAVAAPIGFERASTTAYSSVDPGGELALGADFDGIRILALSSLRRRLFVSAPDRLEARVGLAFELDVL